MSEEVIVRCGSPTLAGIKTGSLFGYPCASRQDAYRDIREMNRLLNPKGLAAVPLCFQRERVLLYLYRPRSLTRDLRNEATLKMLRDAGYPCFSASGCIAALCRRLRAGGPFPHEIGLFLGYPPEDVEGFIENRGRNYKCLGCWKVYGDADKARKSFSVFDKCTACYKDRYRRGMHLKDLAVCV